jgi:hypothetical protein
MLVVFDQSVDTDCAITLNGDACFAASQTQDDATAYLVVYGVDAVGLWAADLWTEAEDASVTFSPVGDVAHAPVEKSTHVVDYEALEYPSMLYGEDLTDHGGIVIGKWEIHNPSRGLVTIHVQAPTGWPYEAPVVDDGSGGLIPVCPMPGCLGSNDSAAARLNGSVIDAAACSWGALKALYR